MWGSFATVEKKGCQCMSRKPIQRGPSPICLVVNGVYIGSMFVFFKRLLIWDLGGFWEKVTNSGLVVGSWIFCFMAHSGVCKLEMTMDKFYCVI